MPLHLGIFTVPFVLLGSEREPSKESPWRQRPQQSLRHQSQWLLKPHFKQASELKKPQMMSSAGPPRRMNGKSLNAPRRLCPAQNPLSPERPGMAQKKKRILRKGQPPKTALGHTSREGTGDHLPLCSFQVASPSPPTVALQDRVTSWALSEEEAERSFLPLPGAACCDLQTGGFAEWLSPPKQESKSEELLCLCPLPELLC